MRLLLFVSFRNWIKFADIFLLFTWLRSVCNSLCHYFFLGSEKIFVKKSRCMHLGIMKNMMFKPLLKPVWELIFSFLKNQNIMKMLKNILHIYIIQYKTIQFYKNYILSFLIHVLCGKHMRYMFCNIFNIFF